MSEPRENRLLRSSRREAIVAAAIWIMATAYTVGYCVWHGYNRKLDDLTFVLGFPDWVFWGIVVPWTVCLVASWWFAFAFMTDEPLGEEHGADVDVDHADGERDHEW